MPAPLSFYFDFISPYAYIAQTQIHAIAEAHGREVTLVPILFAALLNAHGQKGPAEIPAKRIFTIKDAFRKAHRAGLTSLVPPPTHPFNPLRALRVSSLDMPEGDRRRLVAALYEATWAGGSGIESSDAVAAVANAIGLDGPSLVARAEEPAAKERLKRATDDAIGRGVFGVPTIIADGELFWGVDNLAALSAFLDGNDPVTPALLARWARTVPSAQR